jgi:hypothetical protein
MEAAVDAVEGGEPVEVLFAFEQPDHAGGVQPVMVTIPSPPR